MTSSTAGAETHALPGAGAPQRPRWAVIGLAVLAAVLAGMQLGRPELVDPDEPRSALIARIMLDRGDWAAPHLPAIFRAKYKSYPVEGDLLAYWEKPPLYFWLAALAMKVLGPGALAARLPSALAQVAAVLLVYVAGRSLWNLRAGLYAAAAVAVAPLALIMAHVARMEMVLMALMTTMLVAVLRLLHDRPRSWAWTAVLYVSAGLGILAKGPVAVILPAGAVLFVFLARGGWGDLRRLRPLAGLAILLAIAAPWFVYMHFRYPPPVDGSHGGFTYAFFVVQHLMRATQEGFRHSRYLPGYLAGALLAGFVPWTVFLPGACARLLGPAWRERRERPAVLLLLAWAAVVLAAFSASETQLAYYVLPAVPPLAVLVGVYLADRTEPGVRDRLFVTGLWITVVLGAASLVAVVVGLVYAGLWHGRFAVWIAATGAVMLGGIAVLFAGRRRAGVVCAVAGMAVFMTFMFAADPFDIYGSRTTYAEAHLAQESRRPGDKIFAFDHVPYSMAWYFWPEDVPSGRSQALEREVNSPGRTFAVVEGADVADALAVRPGAPGRILCRSPSHVLMVFDVPPPEERPAGP